MAHTDFIKRLEALDRSKHTAEKFRDFCELAYCAYAKLTAGPERAGKLEERYMQIVSTYRDKDDIRAMPEMLAIAALNIAPGSCDFFGGIAGEVGVLDAKAGQFFTPYEVSRMMAEISLQNAAPIIEENGFVTISEPTAGAGSMLLAAADVLSHRGYDPAQHMLAHAADISTLCYHMCFLQLTMRGIPALVERANSLSLERFEAAWTPPVMPFYERHGRLFPKREKPRCGEPAMPEKALNEQLTLFDS